jgi:hypothetical protein
MVERVNKYLKDDFGCDKIYYQGATKVASVLAFGILSICIHQSLRFITIDKMRENHSIFGYRTIKHAVKMRI